MHSAFPDDPMITSRGTKENEESCCAFCKSCSLRTMIDKSSNFYPHSLCKTFWILDEPCAFFFNLRTKHTKARCHPDTALANSMI